MKSGAFAAALVTLVIAQPAIAAPGMGSKVYGATVEGGVSEVELRYGRLTGDEDSGEDALVVELAHGFSDHFYGAVLAEFEREPHESRELEAFALEGIVPLGLIRPLELDLGIYGEYEAVQDESDVIETKLLIQHRKGPFDGRLNLIAEKELHGGEPVEFGYAASVDWETFGEIRLGAAAFGDLEGVEGHFAGPILKAEIEHLGPGELEIETGYLFALGEARHDTDGQLRLNLEYEFRF
jgi:hypothetical protein